MSQADMPNVQREVYKRIKINRIRLDGCKLHRFEPLTFPVALGAKARCLACEGEMSVLDVAQYVRGFVAAGGDPDAILPGYWPQGTPRAGVVHCPKCSGLGYLKQFGPEHWCTLCDRKGHIEPARAIEFIASL